MVGPSVGEWGQLQVVGCEQGDTSVKTDTCTFVQNVHKKFGQNSSSCVTAVVRTLGANMGSHYRQEAEIRF